MLSHIEQKTLPYSAQQMYDLVADVGVYREFLPWCVGSRVKKWEGDSVFFADLVVGYKMIRERFSSRVILDPHSHHIYIEYLRGPLKHLKNHWRFIDSPEGGCEVDFSVEFEFQNKALQGLAKMFFHEVIGRMVSAFEERARSIYASEVG